MQDFYYRINRIHLHHGLVVSEAIHNFEGLDIHLMGLVRNKTTFLRIAYDAEVLRTNN